MEPRIRIRDIAEELGLSTATVSNVIHGKTGKVSDETVKKVMELLEKRQYIPNMASILLAQNDSRIIGVFVNDHEKYEGHTLDDFFIASSLNYLSTEIEKSGFFLMVKKAKCPEEVLRFASMWNMDGIVMIGFCQQDYEYLRSHMRIPFVVYDGFCDHLERILNITIDNFDGGFQMGSHLRSLGHTAAMCLSDNDVGVDLARMAGFAEGFAPGSVTRLTVPMRKQERWDFYREHLEDFRKVTAVFAVSDYYAMDLISFLHSRGIRVPEDISVGGFDDTPMCSLFCPTLTTIQQSGEERARIAIESLQALKAGQEVEHQIMLPVKLVVRNSTGILCQGNHFSE